jgi:murein L,D-transpeptidase YcbB/YkuD
MERVRWNPRAVGARLLLVVAVGGLLLAGCGGDEDAAVKRAEARVADAQEALTEAQTGLTEKVDAFCDASAGYISALDRYGDVLNETTATVGDVKDAGSDLAKPRDDVISSAEDATEARQRVVDAEKELAEARAALAAAKAEADGKTAPPPAPTPTATVAPLAPSESVNRVKQADADFTAAQQGVTDATPVAQASQQFNAAAVALEMSWLRLFAGAGCLTDDQQKQAQQAVSAYTTALQKSLTEAGYYKDKVDGVYGPATVAAVEALQKAHGLPVTGTVDKATDAALRADLQAKGGAAAKDAVASTAAVQQTLKLAGYWTGPVDGQWTPELTEALKSFQTALGVKPTGTVDAATIAALEKAIADGKQGAAPTPTTTS